MATGELKKENSGKKITSGLKLVIFIIFLLFAAAVSYNYFRSENKIYLLTDKKNAKVSFNTAVLINFNKNFSGIPYNYCQDFKLEKPTGVYRIFLLGEASLSGWPYSERQSIGKKIEYNLSKYASGIQFEVITISFAGFNSSNAAEIVQQIFPYKPDLVIIYAGHNEFYGYKGSNSKSGLMRLFTLNAFEGILGNTGKNGSINYDKNRDDLELMLPLYSDEKLINIDKQEYKTAIERFRENITRAALQCKENRTSLILTEMADNNQMPPVGISNLTEESKQLNADLIFNNARMALLRDGNESTAEKLFEQSKELDAFRLRIPAEITACLREISRDYNVTLAGIKNDFIQFSQTHIPGSDLFADYIHPNMTGLDIIAAEYTRLILNKYISKGISPIKEGAAGIMELIENQKMMDHSSAEADLLLEKQRIENALERLKKADFSKRSS